jgi:hypothetical protein
MPIGLSKRKKRKKIEINKNFILIIAASDFLIIGFIYYSRVDPIGWTVFNWV